MSDAVTAAVAAMNKRLSGRGFDDGSIKFVIEEEGAIVIDEAGARAEDVPADCTITASADTFRDLLDGSLDPTAAFMGGRLVIDGDMSLAMRLGTLLS